MFLIPTFNIHRRDEVGSGRRMGNHLGNGGCGSHIRRLHVGHVDVRSLGDCRCLLQLAIHGRRGLGRGTTRGGDLGHVVGGNVTDDSRQVPGAELAVVPIEACRA